MANKTAKLDLAYLTDIQSRSEAVSDNASSTTDAKEMDKKKEPSEITAFDRLVLPEGHKPMIVSLIAQHFRDKESKGAQTEQIDIVRGKGRGSYLFQSFKLTETARERLDSTAPRSSWCREDLDGG